jgi:hypothetical protein
MATKKITYSCGHDGELSLFGTTKDRDRKIEWAETKGLCGECFKAEKRKQADAAGPSMIVRRIAAFDPIAESEVYAARAIRHQIEIERLEEYEPNSGRNGAFDSLAIARRNKANSERMAASAKTKKATLAAIEIIVVNSFSIKDILKSRGYKYSADAYCSDPLMGSRMAGWARIFTGKEFADMATNEIMFAREQGWKIKGETFLETTLQSLGGRCDIIPPLSSISADTVALASENLEQSRRDRAASKAAKAKRDAEIEAENLRLENFHMIEHNAARIIPAEERTEDQPWELEIIGHHGKTLYGWCFDDGWALSAMKELGVVRKLPADVANSPLADKIARRAQKLIAASTAAV